MTKNSGLGKGLGSLIPTKKVAKAVIKDENKEILLGDDSEKIKKVSVDKIEVNPHQPRQIFDHQDLEELIESIKKYGVIQPLIVSKTDFGYELIAGERRLRSCKVIGFKTVPVIVRQVEEQEKLEIALIENIQRKNLNSIEEGVAYQKLMDEFSLTQEEVAEKLGKSRSLVANTVRLLNLPEEIQKALVDNKITQGHARVILGLDTEEEQLKFLNNILNYNFTVRDAEKESRKLTSRKKIIRRKVFDPVVESKEEELRDSLNTKVNIRKKGDEGEIVIHFYSDEELNQIIDNIIN